ncbi:MAG: class D sortase [Chloroflexota bacterium]
MQTPQVGLKDTVLGRSADLERKSPFRPSNRNHSTREASRGERAVSTPAPLPQPGDDAAHDGEVEFDRFKASRLSQIEGKSGTGVAALRRPGPGEKKQDKAATGRTKSGPMSVFDKVLLGLEIAGALVVAWLAFQYVYTVYFDTAPRRVTPSVYDSATPRATVASSAPTVGSGGVVSPTAILRAKETATPFVEVLPPLTGGPDDGTGGPGTPPAPTATATATASPTATVDPVLLLPNRLRIPAMFLDSPVHEVTVNMGQWEVSPMDIGHHEGTANPGETGNVVLAGHRDINSALFRDLDRLQPGDEIFVSNSTGEYRYIVRDSYVIAPDHIEVMDPTPDKRVTLITCTPIGIDTQRLIVVATLDEQAQQGSTGQQ